MLGRLVLILLQLAIAWFAAPQILAYIGIGGDVRIFVHATIFAILVWVTGLVGAQVLKDVATPSPNTLVWALGGALIGAALVVFKVPAMLPLKFAPMFLPLGLAVLGYHARR